MLIISEYYFLSLYYIDAVLANARHLATLQIVDVGPAIGGWNFAAGSFADAGGLATEIALVVVFGNEDPLSYQGLRAAGIGAGDVHGLALHFSIPFGELVGVDVKQFVVFSILTGLDAPLRAGLVAVAPEILSLVDTYFQIFARYS